MPRWVSRTFDHPGQVTGHDQKAEIAAHQVFGSPRRRALGTVGLGPAVQPVPATGQAVAEVADGSGLEFFMTRQVHLSIRPRGTDR